MSTERSRVKESFLEELEAPVGYEDISDFVCRLGFNSQQIRVIERTQSKSKASAVIFDIDAGIFIKAILLKNTSGLYILFKFKVQRLKTVCEFGGIK